MVGLLLVRWFAIAFALIGHCAWWITCYNRVNAVGWPRKYIKVVEKLFALPFFLFPPWLALRYGIAIWNWLMDSSADFPVPFYWWMYAIFSTCFLFLSLPGWLHARRFLKLATHERSRQATAIALPAGSSQELTGTKRTEWLARIPGNQILSPELTHCILAVPGLPSQLQGLKILHLSDLHFTGQLSEKFYHLVLDHCRSLTPDIVALTGDVVDYDKCTDWPVKLLQDIPNVYGRYFVLGNHDKRVSDIPSLRAKIESAGWQDVGGIARYLMINEIPCCIAGNEQPWFGTAPIVDRSLAQFRSDEIGGSSSRNTQGEFFALGLSHSPDQIEWAREHRVSLLLAGHTHGGQIRVPFLGPIIAPSWYGSRFASGTFYLEPTVMHVSRGLAGVHPLRFRCSPEVSLLELTKA